jgi:phosphoglycerol transferase MdoB-like AlkP superfamily enzyme
MRTEYGVVFGRSETELGFRRFDPFLTAVGEASYGLPARLKPSGWRSLFVHPHDLGFYGRDRVMSAAGFNELVGEASFPPPGDREGRYVSDAALAERIIDLAETATGPTLIYAVTIENHGPWPLDRASGNQKQSSAYTRLARNSDAMLSTLMAALDRLGRPALLAFFGDHRPSIPGLSEPGDARHTPYVILRLGAAGDAQQPSGSPCDISPAELHHTLLTELTHPRPQSGL